jgi:hypothetical protein
MAVTEDEEIRVDDEGTIFEITLTSGGAAVDISTATVLRIKFKKPTGTVVTQTAVFSTDGTDGKLRYTTVAGDLDVPKWWKLQGYIEMPNWKGHSKIGEFEVFENL